MTNRQTEIVNCNSCSEQGNIYLNITQRLKKGKKKTLKEKTIAIASWK